MVVPVLLDMYTVPNKGPVELNIQHKFTIHVTAEEAQKTVHSWLISEISCNIGADSPTLVLGEYPVWRVPVYLSYARFGRIGTVGEVDVSITTGKMNNIQECKSAIENAAEQLTNRLPPYLPRQATTQDVLIDTAPAPILQLGEADLIHEGQIDDAGMNESLAAENA